MAYPTISYDASTGSDTSPTGAIATGTNGDISGTTLTLNETVDMTGVADDGSDYLWIDTPAGDRHLFQITSFNPSVVSCTSLTLAESATLARTADSWAVNGTRKTTRNDSTNPDNGDWMPGWVIEFASGTYTSTNFELGTKWSGSQTVAPLTIKAASGWTTRPVIDMTANAYLTRLNNAAAVFLLDIKLNAGTGSGTTSWVRLSSWSRLVAFNCVIDASNGNPTAVISESGSLSVIYLHGCYVTGGSTWGVYAEAYRSQIWLRDTVIDGQDGSYFSSAAVRIAGQRGSVSLRGCLIKGSAGDGVSHYHNNDYMNSFEVDHCTIVDNAGDGIATAGTAFSQPNTIYVSNSILAYNGGYGADDSVSGSHLTWFFNNCAIYSNTSGARNGRAAAIADPNAITLTADPFTNRAGGDYTLNDTAGGGALLKSLAVPDELVLEA